MVTSNRLVIHANQVKDTINRNIYGQFSEHLGRCIYEGVWVGEGSPIPNTRGIRNDVVAALKKIKVPVHRGVTLHKLSQKNISLFLTKKIF